MANSFSTSVVAHGHHYNSVLHVSALQFWATIVFVVLGVFNANSALAGEEHSHGHSHETHALKAHVHGNAELEVAAFGKHIVLALFSPAANLLGFEHAATTPTQIAKVNAVKQTLIEKSLIGINSSTTCELTNTDTEALTEFAQPSPSESNEHRDIEIVWQYQCAPPLGLKGIDASALFAAFSGLEQLNVSVASEAGQTGGRLNPTSPALTLPQ